MTSFVEKPALEEVHVLWITAGLGCDGDTIALTAARQPAIEQLVEGSIPGLPRLRFHNPLLAYEVGDDFIALVQRAADGKMQPLILVIEGSIPDESLSAEGYWAGFGIDQQSGQPIPTCRWIDRIAPHAFAVISAGTCAAYGGIHAIAGNPTGCMGLPDYLGWDWKSKQGVPLICVPGCPIHPDSFMSVLTYVMRMIAGQVPLIPLDDALRPTWLFADTVHENCDRGGYYEQADFAPRYGDRECIVKLGCWGPVAQCNVPRRGWIAAIGGCPNVGGVCIGCTMPGFPDKFQPFMDEPPGAKMSSSAVAMYGRAVRALRMFTLASMNREPERKKPEGKDN
jgi:hydrogenase small subunit